MQKDEQLKIEDFCDGITWKLTNKSDHTFSAPSVCFSLVSNPIEFNDSMTLLLKRCEDLFKETHSCQRQYKKDRIFAQMNIIKTCELDEVIDPFLFLLICIHKYIKFHAYLFLSTNKESRALIQASI